MIPKMDSDLRSDFGKWVKKIGQTDSVLDFNIDVSEEKLIEKTK